MTKQRLAVLALIVLVTAGLTAASASAAVPGKADKLSLELVGQVTNSAPGVSPATSIQYGYIAHMRGLPIFKAEPQNESTALFTFYVETTTVRVINNGPVRIVSREGRITIYSDTAANGNFANPDSFRDGTPILAATLRQQVIINVPTGLFSTLNVSTITSSARFSAGSEVLRLGLPGATFTTLLTGQVATPAGFFAGYTFALADPPKNARKPSRRV